MGRSRSVENAVGSFKGKADEGRAREKGTRYDSPGSNSFNLDGCLNVEESIKLHEALAQLTYSNSNASSFVSSRYGSSENLAREGSSPPSSSNNLLQGGGTSSPAGSFRKATPPSSQTQLPKSNSQARFDADALSAKNSLSQLLKNSQGRSADVSRMLLMVTVAGSVGPLKVLVDGDATAQTVLRAALQVYVREGRLPVLGLDSSWFDLHAGHITFNDALEPNQPIRPLNARNFVMVRRQTQREEVIENKKPKPTSWLEDVWGFGTWWAKLITSASPAFLQGSDSTSAKAWLHELEAPSTAVVSSF
ncbi:hypothetical protein R1sor_007000 [Riccia sorocarpa]|uniref:DUF7054 domain-containing protein n=1 Tax=Riccia sorocarpa TaxID=122646 RepID=A0ABD3HVH7_9MARC